MTACQEGFICTWARPGKVCAEHNRFLLIFFCLHCETTRSEALRGWQRVRSFEETLVEGQIVLWGSRKKAILIPHRVQVTCENLREGALVMHLVVVICGAVLLVNATHKDGDTYGLLWKFPVAMYIF